uniref:G protein-coupled receptor n=1 Tax=Steinernema glaseri TaxID=37863 RepID=A0A1I7ZJ82_9BILA
MQGRINFLLQANYAMTLILLTSTRVILTIHVLFSANFTEGFLKPVEVLHDMSINGMMSVALPIVIERIVATAMVYRYERTSCPWVPLFAISALWVVNALDCFHARDIMAKIFSAQDSIGDRVYMTSSTSVLFLINATSVTVFVFLIIYNIRRFQANAGVHSLTQRYQMAENIRTSRQLLKVIFINFVVTSLSAAIIILNVYMDAEELNRILSQILDLSCAIAAIVIPTVMIISDPKMYMEHMGNFLKLWKLISRSTVVQSDKKNAKRRGPTQTVNNQAMIVDPKAERDVYFNQLSLTWK